MANSDLTPELGNKAEIDRALSSSLDSKVLIGIGLGIQNVTLGIVNTRLALSGLRSSIGTVSDQLKALNENLSAFNKASGRLQMWLIAWTAIMAIATIINVWIAAIR
ncbi:MAG: hypothetical protein KGI60_01955 [Patescibacteria group bacterium]|nr:hypothetical protein [Patescibacteria group bacterium]